MRATTGRLVVGAVVLALLSGTIGGAHRRAIALEAELNRLVRAVAPWLLELPGMGPISAAQVLVS